MLVGAEGRRKPMIRSTFDKTWVFVGTLSALFLLWVVFFYFSITESFLVYSPVKTIDTGRNNNTMNPAFNLQFDPPESTFYDDPNFGYTIDKPIKDWDKKRRVWLKLHPSFEPKAEERVLIVTGSQSKPCKSPIGDHFLLRFYRNKVDYCRIHGYDIFYNNVLLDPSMPSGWAKLPTIRAAMVAHPEAEWIWWLDEDTAFTDMEFKLPLYLYKDYNFVVHGWPKEIYEMKNWLGINDGSFLIRNCQWSMDFLELWADMGPQSPNSEKWGNIVSDVFKYKTTDQSALAYLLYKKHQQRTDEKMLIETRYYLEGYWLQIVNRLNNMTLMYHDIETKMGVLRRRHAEKVTEQYALLREPYLKDAGHHEVGWRRPFVTHFAGCQPCNGKHNPSFSGESCRKAMNKVLNFADNQVLRNYGFIHPNLLDPSFVSPLPFDYPTRKIREKKTMSTFFW